MRRGVTPVEEPKIEYPYPVPKIREHLHQKIRPYKLVVKLNASLTTGHEATPFIPISFPIALRGGFLYNVLTKEKSTKIFHHAYYVHVRFICISTMTF
jgi:hypothetical protein